MKRFLRAAALVTAIGLMGSASAATLYKDGLLAELPSAFGEPELSDGMLVSYNETHGRAWGLFAKPCDDANLADVAATIAEETFSDTDYFFNPDKTVRERPFANVHGWLNGIYTDMCMFLDGGTLYMLNYFDADGMDADESFEYSDVLMQLQFGVEAPAEADSETVSEYEIVATDSYARAGYQGTVYRVYVPGVIDDDVLNTIYREITLQDDTMIRSVFFYDMRSGADGSGSAVASMIQNAPNEYPSITWLR